VRCHCTAWGSKLKQKSGGLELSDAVGRHRHRYRERRRAGRRGGRLKPSRRTGCRREHRGRDGGRARRPRRVEYRNPTRAASGASACPSASGAEILKIPAAQPATFFAVDNDTRVTAQTKECRLSSSEGHRKTRLITDTNIILANQVPLDAPGGAGHLIVRYTAKYSNSNCIRFDLTQKES
jgi:hypothetical protein